MKLVKNKLFLVLVSLFITVVSSAQTTDFDRLTSASDENSLVYVNIDVDISKVNTLNYIDASITIFDNKKRTDGNQIFSSPCLVRYRGASSTAYDKKSFGIKLVDTNGESVDANILGIRSDDSWILDAMAVDRGRMRNRLCFDIWNSYNKTPYTTDYDSRNGTLGEHVEVFINKQYHGLYCMTDKVNRKLLDLKKSKSAESIHGVMFKGDQWENAVLLYGYDDEASTDNVEWEGWSLDYPDEYPSDHVWEFLKGLNDLYALPAADFAAQYDKWLYKSNMVDYFCLILLTNYRDCVLKNTYLSIVDVDKGHCMMVTPWDMDTSFGGEWDGSRYDISCSLDNISQFRFFNAFYAGNIDGFRDDVCEKWNSWKNTKYNEISAMMDKFSDKLTISGAWQREYDKWNGNPVPLSENLSDETDYMKSWLQRNIQSVSLEVTSSVEDVIEDDSDSSSYYTLAGLPISNLNEYKGVAIRKGKKIIVK